MYHQSLRKHLPKMYPQLEMLLRLWARALGLGLWAQALGLELWAQALVLELWAQELALEWWVQPRREVYRPQVECIPEPQR